MEPEIKTPFLGTLVFVVGSASLGAEIAAVRLLAPYFGASTIVWANTIAVVLVALAAGYWLGGRAADRYPEGRVMCAVVLIAALMLALVPFVARPLLRLAADALDNVSATGFLGSLIAVTVLVAAPVLLLGTVSPWALRLAVRDVAQAGTVAGRLYALSTAGSLVGTLVSALVLIPLVGTRRTFLIFAFSLALVATAGLRNRVVAGAATATVLIVLLLPQGTVKAAGEGRRVIYEQETPYQYARVVERPDGSRTLELNEGQAVHSRYRPDTVLTGDVWDDYLVLPLLSLRRAPRSIAILGNAAGTTARAYGRLWPATQVDGVEIDGALSEIGRRFFGMSGPRLRVHSADARPFLARSDRRYDAIFMDAYRQPYIPFYLATREFYGLVKERLTPRGTFIANVAHPAGSALLERVVTRTLREVFPHVVRDPVTPTNTLVIASAVSLSPPALGRAAVPDSLRPLAERARARLGAPLDGGTVYTDDRAPVEWLIDRSFVNYASGR